MIAAAQVPLDEGDPLPPDGDRPSTAAVLNELYRRERPALLRFLSRRVGGDHAEDMVQQLFLKMAKRGEQHAAGLAIPGAYLREAARNLIHDRVRAAARQGEDSHFPAEDVALSSGDPVALLEARDRLARLEAAVARLKPLTREIFLACRLDGYSYAEIAQRTGLSVRGVEKQMSRAIKQLGRHLRRHD